jgi:leucine efflux protein
MFGIQDYGAFVSAVIIFLLIPGPGNLALAISTGKSGFAAGMAVMLGVMAGDQVLLWLAVAGMAAVLAANPKAFMLMQWAGAAYLVWLGFKMLLSKAGRAPALTMRPHHYFRQAFVITIFNPKAILFYMAFFPQFVDPAAHVGLTTFAVMAATIAVITAAYCLVAVSIAHFAAGQLRAMPAIGRFVEKLAGLCLVGFGVRLAFGK